MELTPKWWHYFIALIPPLMGAVSYVLSKYVIDDISPIALLFYRWLVAVAILTPFMIRKFVQESQELKKHFKVILIAALSGITLFNLFVYYALQYTSSTNTAIIVNTFPIIVLVLGILINKEKLKNSQICSTIIAFIGVLIIVSHGDILNNLVALFNNLGDFLSLIAAFAWALYIYSVKFKPKTLSQSAFIYACFLLGFNLILPIYLFDVFYLKHSFAINLCNVGVIFCLGFGVSVIGMLALNFSILHIGANMSAIFFYTAPMFTAILATVILKEKFQAYHLLGMIFILFGINLPLLLKYISKKRLANLN